LHRGEVALWWKEHFERSPRVEKTGKATKQTDRSENRSDREMSDRLKKTCAQKQFEQETRLGKSGGEKGKQVSRQFSRADNSVRQRRKQKTEIWKKKQQKIIRERKPPRRPVRPLAALMKTGGESGGGEKMDVKPLGKVYRPGSVGSSPARGREQHSVKEGTL